MNDFIKGDTSLIKDLTNKLNRLRQDNNKLLDELNITKLTLAEKEQERQDILNDNKYNKNLCSKLTQELAETNKLMQEYLSKCLSLEQQLTESKNEVEEYIAVRDDKIKVINRQTTKINKLKQQLEEKDATIKYLQDEKDGIEQANELLNKMFIEVKEELTKKEKEIEKLKELHIYNPTMEMFTNVLAKQNQTAIKELEKVKAKVRDVKGALALCEIEVQIDKQIKELKGGNK